MRVGIVIKTKIGVVNKNQSGLTHVFISFKRLMFAKNFALMSYKDIFKK